MESLVGTVAVLLFKAFVLALFVRTLRHWFDKN